MDRSLHLRASRAGRDLIRHLHSSEVPAAAAFAAKLEGCRDTNPCRSGACSTCGLAFQPASVCAVERFIRVPAKKVRSRATAVTIVPTAGCVMPDELSVEVFRLIGAKIVESLAVHGFPPALIRLEASFNEDWTGELPDHFCIHGHIIHIDWVTTQKVKALKDAFPPGRFVRRPVLCEPIDQDVRSELYMNKSEPGRRVTDWVKDHPTRAPYRDTKRRALRPWQAVQLALVEDQLGFGRRLLTHGIDDELVRRHLAGLGWPRDGP